MNGRLATRKLTYLPHCIRWRRDVNELSTTVDNWAIFEFGKGVVTRYNKEKALVLVEQKQVLFYEDEITAVLVKEGQHEPVYVPIRPVCEFLGLSWTGQRERTERDAVLSEEV